LLIRAGEDWVSTFTYLVAGNPTQVDDPQIQVRPLPHLDPVLDLSGEAIGQDDPGVLVMSAPAQLTSTIPPGYDYQWDLFGTVGGRRVKLVDTSLLDVQVAVTHA
jgi:hypothetical protein